jgi:hypothetical protein
MMTPKEKADELCGKYYNRIEHTLSEEYTLHNRFIIKQCALIAIDEILDFMMNDDIESETCYWANHPLLSYWYQVKQEIENK